MLYLLVAIPMIWEYTYAPVHWIPQVLPEDNSYREPAKHAAKNGEKAPLLLAERCTSN